MDCCQPIAIDERMFTDAGDGVSDGDGGESAATGERIFIDGGDGVWDGDGC